jgi:hypothetical protein
VLPTGTWRLRAQRAQFFEPREEDKSPRAVVYYRAMEPMDDVDPDELGDLPEGYQFKDTPIEAVFFLSELRDWDNLREHLKLLGVDVDSGSVKDSLDAAKGREVNAYLSKETYKDRQGNPGIKNKPGSFAAID